MSCGFEPAIWSRETGQQIPCFDRCQLIIKHGCPMSKRYTVKPDCMSLSNYYWEYGRHVARSAAVVAVVCTHPRAISLVMISIRKLDCSQSPIFRDIVDVDRYNGLMIRKGAQSHSRRQKKAEIGKGGEGGKVGIRTGKLHKFPFAGENRFWFAQFFIAFS